MRLQRLIGVSFIVGALGASTLYGLAQQQAAEAPASARPGLTRPAVAGLNGLVTAGHPIAASAGLQMLVKGGNAFDAVAAVGAMEGLAEPEMNGIGGNGFMTVFHRESGKVWSLSMAGAAPKALKPEEMTPATLNAGVKAGIVPGNLGGYLYALERFGTMSVAEVFAPTIQYAEQGYPIDPMLAASISRGQANLAKYPTSARIFLPEGRPLKAGELLRNPDYAATLRKLVDAETAARKAGATRSKAIMAAYDRFYRGDIAQEFDRFFKEQGGVLTAADLAAYTPEWTEPLRTSYRGYEIFSNPATSRGGFEVLMQATLVEGFDLAGAGAGSAAALHAQIESIKVAKADIYRYVADPAFAKVPTEGLLAKDYAASRRTLIDPTRAGGFPLPGAPAGAPATSAGPAAGPAFDDAYDAELHTTIVLGGGSVRQCGGLHADAGRAVREQRGGGVDGTAAEQRHADRIDVALSDGCELCGRGQDSDSEQLAGGGAEGRRAGLCLRHAGWRDDRADGVSGAGESHRPPDARAGCDRGAALCARGRPELLQAGRRHRRDHRGPGAAGHGGSAARHGP